VVDDIADMRVLLRTVLRKRGMDVVAEAGNGSQAVALAGEHEPDIVVLDLGLPDLEGTEVLSGIRNHAPRCSVVVFSGVRPTDRREIASRVEGFVTKADDLALLLDTVEHAARRPVEVVSRVFPQRLRSAALARTFTESTLRGWALPQLVGDGMVVVSELVTNAVVHAGTPCEVRLSQHSRSLRIAVVDFGDGTPEPRPPAAGRLGGRGLQIVDSMATAWGFAGLGPRQKLVWAELPVALGDD
jgi:DNA-binding NarL/FixJ family response regulator